jgi:diguanylate cyclase (GGDEF)-like protein
MIPGVPTPEDDRARPDREQSIADQDQTHADADQTASDRDQGASDLDQLAAQTDQAASDRELAHGLDRDVYDSSREARVRTTQVRRETSTDRLSTASARDATAHERDLSALTRDRAADARDREDDDQDAETASLTSFFATRRETGYRYLFMAQPETGYRQIILRAARDRQRAAADRARSAGHRADAGQDRDRAASDRHLAADDRSRAAEDRNQAAAEREADEVDALTGARRRGPGLLDMQREIDRARRGSGRLIAAYVDVDGLKATNDAKGHHAGDILLKHVAGVLRSNLRSYEPIIRLGGDEFVCALSDANIETVRGRFDQITAELRLSPDDGSITVGYAALEEGDSAMDLIDRADSGLIASRENQRSGRDTAP